MALKMSKETVTITGRVSDGEGEDQERSPAPSKRSGYIEEEKPVSTQREPKSREEGGGTAGL